MLPPPKATILLLFVHGFKGHDLHTFLDFPTRIMTIFTNAKINLDVESIIYPQYDTRGDFSVAVKTFAEWTRQQVEAREVFNIRAYGPQKQQTNQGEQIETKTQNEKIPPVYVCFVGHSMGGLVAADAAILLEEQLQKSPVIGILAFDTPYFGLNHTVFTHAAYERATGMAQKAIGAYNLMSAYIPAATTWNALNPATISDTQTKKGIKQKGEQEPGSASNGFSVGSLWSSTSVKSSQNEKRVITTSSSSSSSGSKWSWGSVALGVGAAVLATGAAVTVNSHVNKGMEYITSHLQFVGILWNSTQLTRRVADVLKLPIGFHCFYTQVQIPASSANNWKTTSRTFVELASIPSDMQSKFSPRMCSGQDEIEAHMEMFNPSKNFDYYQMGDETVKCIKTMVEDALIREAQS